MQKHQIAATLSGLVFLVAASTSRAEAPPGGFEEEAELRSAGGAAGFAKFSMGPEGDWEFSGSVSTGRSEDIDYYVTCAVRSSAGELFQMSVQGTIDDDSEQSGSVRYEDFPKPGRPLIAGRNPELAAHWSEVFIDASWKCSLGSNEHGEGTSISEVVDDISKGLGAAKTVVDLVNKLNN
jgi:hypothetical protein